MHNHQQPGRHGSAFSHSPPQPLQYGSFAPGPVPPMYQVKHPKMSWKWMCLTCILGPAAA